MIDDKFEVGFEEFHEPSKFKSLTITFFKLYEGSMHNTTTTFQLEALLKPEWMKGDEMSIKIKQSANKK